MRVARGRPSPPSGEGRRSWSERYGSPSRAPRSAAHGAGAVGSCSASTTLAGRVASFEDVTRYPQNDRTRGLGRIASPRRPGPGTGCPVVHPGPEEPRDGRRVSVGCGVGCAAPADRSPHDAPPDCTRSPARRPPSRRADRPFGVFPGPLRNGGQSPGGVDEHGGGRRVTRERRKDYRVRGGTSRPAVHSGAEHAAARGVLRGRVGIGAGLGRAARPPPGPLVGRPSPSRRDTSPPSRRRR